MDLEFSRFMDWSEGQKKQFFNIKPSDEPDSIRPMSTGPGAPASWDWRDHGAVTSVKQQGSCGSCWSYSATAQYESMMILFDNKVRDLAEQFALQCDSYSTGCQGGWT